MKTENADVIGDKYVKDKDDNLALGEKDKLRTWKEHYEQLLNVEFDLDETVLSTEHSVEGPAIYIYIYHKRYGSCCCIENEKWKSMWSI